MLVPEFLEKFLFESVKHKIKEEEDKEHAFQVALYKVRHNVPYEQEPVCVSLRHHLERSREFVIELRKVFWSKNPVIESVVFFHQSTSHMNLERRKRCFILFKEMTMIYNPKQIEMLPCIESILFQ